MLKIERIKKVEGDYEGLSFVLRALDPDEPGRYPRFILWDGSCYWGTDGKRLHYYYAKSSNPEIGTYKLISKDKNTIVLDKVENIKYPDITVLPLFRNNGPKWEIEVNLNENQNEGQYALSTAYTKIIRKMEEDETLNFDFIKNLPLDKYTVYSHGSKDPICFANGNKGAAIMPMRVL
jgi:hypothetical protein